jgi:cell division protein FtsB
LYDWLVAGKAKTAVAAGVADGWDFRRRRLPREELLWEKEIDNARVMPKVDARDSMASLGMACGVICSSVALIAVLLPGGFNLMSNHRMEQLRSERGELTNQLRQLRAHEAELKSPQQLATWSEDYVTPAARAMLYAPATQETVARLEAH